MLSNIFGPSAESLDLLRQDGTFVPLQTALEGKKYLLLYFSASWSPPCRMFTPQLALFHDSFHDQHGFDVIFVSRDRDERSMMAYFLNPRHSRCAVRGGEGSHGNWYALPFEAAKTLGGVWMRHFAVAGIPTVLLFCLATGELLARDGRAQIALHAHTAEGFPWRGRNRAEGGRLGLHPILAVVMILAMVYYLWQ